MLAPLTLVYIAFISFKKTNEVVKKVFITMFSDFNSEVAGFEPVPETQKLVSDSNCQTVDLKTSNQGTQTTNTESTASQATPEDALITANDHPYDADKLLTFLNRILPHLEEELKSCDSTNDLNFKQNEFNEFGSVVTDGHERSEQSCRQTILKPDFCKEKVISCLSWNSSYVMLAVACSELHHKGWCCHETSIGLYNTEKSHFEKEPPSQLINVPGCVRCVAFHSHIPSLLAAGLYSGELVVWDLKHDEDILVNNKKGSGDEAPHVDVITFLSWREDENGLWLITAGRDGRIILWKVTVTNLTYEVHQRFLILKQHLVTTAAPDEHLEVLHMDFQPSKGPYFIAACGGGTVFYCSLTMARSLPSSLQYKDPILRSYKPRKGIITHVACSSDLFASCGTDSEIHIFKYEQESPMLKIYTSYPLFGVRWNSPKELVSWGDSTVECHRVQDSGGRSTICEVEGSISTVAFKIPSISNSRKFAIGNERGDVLILRDWIST